MQVLDKGSIELLNVFGNDLMVVNTARVSFAKESSLFTEKDEKLIKYLANHKHLSPFYHPRLQWRVKAPISVHRQWERHRIGTDMNSESTRYVEVKNEYYVPSEFRSQSKSNKQGSAEPLAGDYRPIWKKSLTLSATGFREEVERGGPTEVQYWCRQQYIAACESAYSVYEDLLDAGVAKEQAREVLPLCTYVSWIWTASLAAVVHFLKLRDEAHAQYEIRAYAKAMKQLAMEHFPVSISALLEAA